MAASWRVIPNRKRPSIMSFPNETLTMILNEVDIYVTGPENEQFPKDLPPMALHPDLVALRAVSRLFRRLVHEMPFWYTDDVHIAALLSPVSTLRRAEDPRWRTIDEFPPWQKELKHLENHLQDEDWVRCFERRTKWRFRHPPLLFAILKRVPSFHRNATSVIFDFLDWSPSKTMYPGASSIDNAIATLGVCRNLVSLEINHQIGQLSLNLIPISCPGLKYLRIADAAQHRDLIRSNLDGLAALEELDIRDLNIYFDGNILPMSSATTLTRLALLCPDGVFCPDFPNSNWSESLNSFINLDSLSLSPLSRSMAECIISASFMLSDFRILLWFAGEEWWEDEEYDDLDWLISNLDKLMSSPSLSRLKELRLAIVFPEVLDDNWDWEFFGHEMIVGQIVRHQRTLEKLVLNADYGNSSMSLLAQLVNLRSLVWHLPHLNPRLLDASLLASKKEFLRAAFEQTSTYPVIEVIPFDCQSEDLGERHFDSLVYQITGS